MKKTLTLAVAFITTLAFADLESMRARLPQIKEYKAKGAIGEQADGFLGVVKDEGQARSIVDAENRDRREEYEKRAKSQGQTFNVFAAVMGEARIKKEDSGNMVRGANGSWTKK